MKISNDNKIKIKWLIIKLLLISVFVALDLITKMYFEKLYFSGELDIEVIKNILSFTYAQNTGAAFSMFSSHTLILAIISLVFIISFFIYDYFNHYNNFWEVASIVLIASGGIGNLVDRIFIGYVRDFIRFDFINFPIFNVADVLLTIGIIAYAIYMFFYYGKNNKTIKTK